MERDPRSVEFRFAQRLSAPLDFRGVFLSAQQFVSAALRQFMGKPPLARAEHQAVSSVGNAIQAQNEFGRLFIRTIQRIRRTF